MGRIGKIIAGTLFLTCAIVVYIHFLNSARWSDDYHDYYCLQTTVSKPPEIVTGGRGRSPMIYLYFEQFPTIWFDVNWDKSVDTSVKHLKIRDSVTVLVLKEEYHRAINKQGTALQKWSTGRHLHVYALYKDGKNQIYFTQLRKGTIRGNWLYLIHAFFLLWIFVGLRALYMIGRYGHE